ncbi:MAG: hypothetical protein HRT76_13565 [Halieaceae bacterium]|nr:hypothetical protein [Halieaceae bacterium]
MPVSRERFPNRYAGSAFQPFVVEVRNANGKLRPLTGQSATFTIRKAKGVASVAEALPNSNTPDASGTFEFQPTAAMVSSPGEYVVTVIMMLNGLPEVGRFGLTLDPAT